MSQKFVIANWKMNGSYAQLSSDLSFYLKSINKLENVVFALPSIYLGQVNRELGNKLSLASQDVSCFPGYGAYTGEISAEMLKDCGVKFAIIGHSERRINFFENDEQIAAKLKNLIKTNITPILCIGEDLEIRKNGLHLAFLEKQLSFLNTSKLGLNGYKGRLFVAYEPVWAIGSGVTPKLEQIAEVMNFIQDFQQKYLPYVKIMPLYGGSVSSANAQDILSINCISGVLVGGASLKVGDFSKICKLNT